MDLENCKMYIGGEWVDSGSGETFTSINPAAPREVMGTFPKGRKEDVEEAVEAAEGAFEAWSDVPPPKRGEVLLRVAKLLRERKEDLAQTMTREMGKVLMETRGDVQEAIDIAEYMAGEGRRLLGHTTTSELKDKFCMTVRRPVGVYALITPWNFPIAIPAWKVMPALICGNTVVLKPSTDTPLCAVKFVEVLEKAGVPKGVVNLITGPGGEVGRALIEDERVRGVSFTGHRDTGNEILCRAGLKRVGLEMGGKNPILIMDDADLDLALDGVLWGGYGTTGQRCTAASRVIVHEEVEERFVERLLERIRKLRLGNGLDPETDVGPLVNRAAREKCQRYVQIGQGEGATMRCGGKPLEREGFFFEPTLFTDVAPEMRIAQEEIFGPVVSLLTAGSLKEAIEIANGTEYGLSSALYTQDVKQAFQAIEKLDFGITYINASTIGAEVHLPFGGVKSSGNGTMEAGIEGINEFSTPKVVYVDYSGKLQRAQIDVE